MSYTQVKNSIKEEIKEHILIYKNGNIMQQQVAEKMEKLIGNIHCFQCLDTKQSWDFRGFDYKNDGKGDYYVMTCAVCPQSDVKDNWIKDSKTNELYGISGIKLFNKMDYSSAERFQELEKYIYLIHPEINQEPPIYNKTDKTVISVNKKTFKLKIEVGNIINQCKKIFEAYCGNVISISSILNSISLNIYSCENNDKQEQILCEEIDKTKFIYVKITNKSATKKKSILGLYEYNKYKLDINIYISLLKPSNQSAYNQCQNIVSKLGINEINEVSKIFLSIQ